MFLLNVEIADSENAMRKPTISTVGKCSPGRLSWPLLQAAGTRSFIVDGLILAAGQRHRHGGNESGNREPTISDWVGQPTPFALPVDPC
jgi:hypothetical protein